MVTVTGFKFGLAACLSVVAAVGASVPARAEFAVETGGHVTRPASSLDVASKSGLQVRTHLQVYVPRAQDPVVPPTHAEVKAAVKANVGPPANGYAYLQTPAALACVYKLVATQVAGCNPYQATVNPTGGSRVIAIVDAYDNPTAASDLATFSAQFGLPSATLQVVYASGTKPAANAGWALESSLDIEWAHAMAPGAKIILVEAASSSMADMMAAVTVASNLVAAAGGGQVSMSWGSSEFATEKSYDGYFLKPGVVYFASAGDAPGTSYPSVSPNVVSVGGTALSRNPLTGMFQKELSWQQTGGGPSIYESRPAYQATIAGITAMRGTPDVAAIADPTTGVWVYSNGSWYIVGGTSVAAPVWAGIVNAAGKFNPSSAAELTMLYANAATSLSLVNSGACGPYEGYLAGNAWSFCTGFGSPLGLANK